MLIAEVRKAGSDLAKGIESLLPRKERLLEAVKGSRETNPMLGLRGCRLGIMFPEITEMQVRAIFEAACRLKREGVDVRPEIMIPLVGLPEELRIERQALEKEAKSVMDREGISVAYKFGTMIEIPRAALVADKIADHAEFFSFGTNDLTQTTMGYSRDDAEPKFLLDYVEQGILPRNPYQTIDRDGVGQRIAARLPRLDPQLSPVRPGTVADGLEDLRMGRGVQRDHRDHPERRVHPRPRRDSIPERFLRATVSERPEHGDRGARRRADCGRSRERSRRDRGSSADAVEDGRPRIRSRGRPRLLRDREPGLCTRCAPRARRGAL